MLQPPSLAEQLPTELDVLEPYRQFLKLADYMQASSPTDFRKNISAMGAAESGFTVEAAQALGALAVRKSDTDAKMVTAYRKSIRNELACRLVVDAAPDPLGGGFGTDSTDGAGVRYWRYYVTNPQ